MSKELDEALKMFDSFGGDERCGLNFHYSEILVTAYRSSLSTIRAQEEEIAGLKLRLGGASIIDNSTRAIDAESSLAAARDDIEVHRTEVGIQDLEIIGFKSSLAAAREEIAWLKGKSHGKCEHDVDKFSSRGCYNCVLLQVEQAESSLATERAKVAALADEQCGSECVKAHGELAELRKRTGEAVSQIERAKKQAAIALDWKKYRTDFARASYYNDALKQINAILYLPVLASPPSPDQSCGKCDSATEYLGECPHTPPAPVEKNCDCHNVEKENCPRTPVESKPKEGA